MHVAMRDGNVINLKIYASRKNKPLIEYHGVQNLWYAQLNNNFVTYMQNRSFRFHWYQFYFNEPKNKRITRHWTLESTEGHIWPTAQPAVKGHKWPTTQPEG